MIPIEEYIDGTKFESIADFGFGDKFTIEYPLDINRLNNFLNSFVEERLPIIYVDSDRVKNFFNLIEDYCEKNFILLSHNGDTTFNQDDIDKKPKCIKKWFGQNINIINTEEIVSLPIGLERPHWSKQRYGINGHKHNKIYEYSKLNFEKNKICYINFTVETNLQKRNWIVPHFNKEEWCHIRMGGLYGNLDNYFRECKESYYVLCPDGNGIDCHRNWEMIYLGIVPIIEYSHFHNQVYSDLPVLIVDSFKNLNKNLLIEKINSFQKNEEKLKFSYWKKIILNNEKSDINSN